MAKHPLSVLLLLCSMGLPFLVHAEEPDWEAIASVQAALEAEESARTIIAMLLTQGHSQIEATEIAVGATVGEQQLDLAREGVCGSLDAQEAQAVALAASAVAEEDAADSIKGFVQRYLTGGCSDAERDRPSRYLPSGSALNASDQIITTTTAASPSS
jgi:hypothetical protein